MTYPCRDSKLSVEDGFSTEGFLNSQVWRRGSSGVDECERVYYHCSFFTCTEFCRSTVPTVTRSKM